jgi:FkbM family methyltransferase
MQLDKAVINYLRETKRNYKVKSKIPNLLWAQKVLSNNVDLDEVTYDSTTQGLHLTNFGITLQHDNQAFFLRGMHFARNLKEEAKATFQIIDDKIVIEMEGHSLYVETFEELFILNEIFVDGVYNIILPESVIVMDIGMNVGYSSLYFSQNPNVQSIYAFEPFEDTYKQALRNFLMNEPQSKKINHHNFGLGSKDEVLFIDYSEETRGSIGINGIPDRDDIDRSLIRKEKFTVKDVSSILDDIIEQHPNTEIVAKIDCEGSEYEIIKALSESEKLSKIRTIMLEWHDCTRNNEIIYQMKQAGFEIISLSPHSTTVGMMYATNVK